MTAVAMLRPLGVKRWPEGDRHGLPFLVSVKCPFCHDEHTHGINAGVVLRGHVWSCTSNPLRRGEYRMQTTDRATPGRERTAFRQKETNS